MRPKRGTEQGADLQDERDGRRPRDRMEQGRFDQRRQLPDALQNAQPGKREQITYCQLHCPSFSPPPWARSEIYE